MKRQGCVYEIRVNNTLDQSWQDWFEGMSITSDQENETVISGRVADQAALYGLLNRIQILNLRLSSVRQIPEEVNGEWIDP